MKYIKTIFIFFISLNLSALYAATTTLAEPTLSADIQKADLTIEANKAETTTVVTAAEENELQNWESHLSTLTENWNASTNAPEPSWTAKAIEIAVNAVKANKDLIEKLKSEFLDAMNVQSTKFTADTISVVAEFNSAIDKELELPELAVEEPKTDASTAEKTSTTEPEQAPEAEAVTTSTETTTPTETTTTASATESKTEPEKKEEPKKEEEKKEDFVKEWKQCLTDIQKKQGNINKLTDKAAELALKLQDPTQTPKPMKTAELTQAFERALIVRGGLSPAEKDSLLSDFASALGVYIPIPASQMDYYQPTQSELTMLAQEEELAKMQRKQMEQEKTNTEQNKLIQATLLKTEQMEREAEIRSKAQEKALLESGRIHENIALKLKEKIEDELKQTQKNVEKLRAELKADKKAAAEKSLLTRAKETVTGLIWGKSEKKEESIAEKEKKVEQLNKQIEEKEAILFKQTCQKNEMKKRAREIQELNSHELTKNEIKRKAELEAEQRECARIAAINNFERQEKEWPVFMNDIRNMENPTRESNNKSTKEAIERAKSLINLASGIPSIKISDLEQMLKETFAKALVDQKHRIQHSLNIVVNQGHFNNAINDIEGEIKAMQSTKQEMYNRE